MDRPTDTYIAHVTATSRDHVTFLAEAIRRGF